MCKYETRPEKHCLGENYASSFLISCPQIKTFISVSCCEINPGFPASKHSRKSKTVCFQLADLDSLRCFVWPLAWLGVQAGRKEFFLLGCELANLPAVIGQIFCGMCWWTIAALIWSGWASGSQHLAGFWRADGCAWCWQALTLWTQYPLLLLDTRSIKMRLCFALLKCFDVQKGNCLSLVVCYCVALTTAVAVNHCRWL